MFGLIDADMSVELGNALGHLSTSMARSNTLNGQSLVSAINVENMSRQWCVILSESGILESNLAESINYACSSKLATITIPDPF